MTKFKVELVARTEKEGTHKGVKAYSSVYIELNAINALGDEVPMINEDKISQSYLVPQSYLTFIDGIVLKAVLEGGSNDFLFVDSLLWTTRNGGEVAPTQLDYDTITTHNISVIKL
jgi:hypothetical protein